MSLRLLLFLTSAMLGVSSAVKLRAISRAGLGLAPLVLAEAIAAVGLAVSGASSAVAAPGMRWSVPVAILLLLASTVNHALRLQHHRLRRSQTEDGRLRNFLKYSSGPNLGD